jgi:methylenetetrahydrofolate dehydrogenase (NADP+)/methenyltetrahydrofolate cyclohydrolase
MAARIIDGTAVAREIRAEAAREAAALREAGTVPGLAVVLVGSDGASEVYVRSKARACEEAGMRSRVLQLPEETAAEELAGVIDGLNADPEVHGVLVQLPLPPHLNPKMFLERVHPAKDVDGFHPLNAGQLYLGRPTYVPGTALGVLELLDAYDVPLEGAHAVVLGRSDIVGKPVAMLLLQRHATVTLCHSRTRDLRSEVSRGDVVVAAVGVPGLVEDDWVKEGACLIDVGITRTGEGIVGDVAPAAAERAALLTPVPGGVGPMTVAMLLTNAVRAARYRRRLLAFPGA